MICYILVISDRILSIRRNSRVTTFEVRVRSNKQIQLFKQLEPLTPINLQVIFFKSEIDLSVARFSTSLLANKTALGFKTDTYTIHTTSEIDSALSTQADKASYDIQSENHYRQGTKYK